MPGVNTGMIPDDETDDVLAGATTAAPAPPPPEVAGIEVLAAEQEASGEDTRPFVDVRGKRFFLRSKVPGMLLMQLSKAQTDLQAKGASLDTNRQAAAIAKTSDALTKLVVEEQRTDFIEHCEDIDPPIEMGELMGLVGEMMVAITGRPTGSASG